MRPPVNTPFGQRSWADVSARVKARLVRRWPRTPWVDIEDAVSAAMLDLYDYWVELPSSLTTDTDRNFRFAIWRGAHVSSQFLVQRFQQWESEPLLEEMLGGYDDDDSDVPGDLYDIMRDGRPTPEEWVMEVHEQEALRDAVGRLDGAEWESWLSDLIEGRTVRAAGQTRGVSHVAIVLRRQAGLNRLRRELR